MTVSVQQIHITSVGDAVLDMRVILNGRFILICSLGFTGFSDIIGLKLSGDSTITEEDSSYHQYNTNCCNHNSYKTKKK